MVSRSRILIRKAAERIMLESQRESPLPLAQQLSFWLPEILGYLHYAEPMKCNVNINMKNKGYHGVIRCIVLS
jgi:hypothetical protein